MPTYSLLIIATLCCLLNKLSQCKQNQKKCKFVKCQYFEALYCGQRNTHLDNLAAKIVGC